MQKLILHFTNPLLSLRTARRRRKQSVEKVLRAQRASNRKLRLAAISIKTGSRYLGFYTNRWQVRLKG
ncbi:MAG: hypothetical protein ACLRO1_04905, partial [Agathobaculum sp.]